jgi:Zn-dependent peptidase ImmA (M78 family)
MEQLLPNTRYLLRLAHAFQLSLKELNDGVNPAERKIFRDIRLSNSERVPQIAQQVQDYLGIDLRDQAAWSSADEALKAWRSAVEAVGIFVFKQSFKQKSISGFCLMDSEFPIIFINNGTAKTRQIFTLFHELSHLLIGVNSISKVDDSYIEALPQHEQKMEQLCNALAAEILVPSGDFLSQLDASQTITDESLQNLANRYHVSREVILRRLLDAGEIEAATYNAKIKQWLAESKTSNHGQSGGSYYATQATYLGDNYLRLVFNKYYQGKLDLEQVAEHLGVKAKNVAGLEAQLSGRGSAA